jgi:acyl-CoA thioester hydrolase
LRIQEIPLLAVLDDFRMVVTLRARFRDTDGMGHVNNVVFFTYCEEARAAYFREVAGVADYRKIFIILARAACDFRSPILSGEEFDIGVRVERMGRKSFDMVYRAHARGDGRLLMEASSVQVAYDYEADRSIAVPQEFRLQVEAFERRSFPAG